jgi:hypothetical protein
MIMSLPGIGGAAGSDASAFGASAFGASIFGASAWGASAMGASWSGAILGESTLTASDSAAATGSLGALCNWGTSDPALREPVSPLLCSAMCSLTFKFSSKD